MKGSKEKQQQTPPRSPDEKSRRDNNRGERRANNDGYVRPFEDRLGSYQSRSPSPHRQSSLTNNGARSDRYENYQMSSMRNSEPRSDPVNFNPRAPDTNYRGQWENRTYQSRPSTPQRQQRPFSPRPPSLWEYTEQRQGRNYGYQPETRDSPSDIVQSVAHRGVNHTYISSSVNPVDVGCVEERVVTQTIMQFATVTSTTDSTKAVRRETYMGLGHRATEAHSNWPGWFERK